ncbi:MAG: lysophospholipid acyltransferase family protein [Moraxella sp.]|nr:lysophospholipid acyltransferase family protein [Moraxella sp.]
MLPTLTHSDLGDNVPRRHGKLVPMLAQKFLTALGWRIAGTMPNIPQAVLLAVPHTSNIDGVYAIPTVLALDIDIKIMGKKQLFAVPIFSHFLRWVGVIPIDRDKKGSVLQANIDRFKTGEPLLLALAPEGTRDYTDSWKTGFYYLAVGAGVPILPVAMDYATKEVRFLPPFYPTGDIETDLPQIYAYYQGVVPKHPARLSKPLQELGV